MSDPTKHSQKKIKKIKGVASKLGDNQKNIKTQKALINNLVSLQKVMLGLSTNLNNLTKHIEKLLDIFENAAKTLANRELEFGRNGEKEGIKKIMEKLDSLSQHAGLIGRGLALMHEVNAKGYPDYERENLNPPIQKNLQNPSQLPIGSSGIASSGPKILNPEMQGYIKSIASSPVYAEEKETRPQKRSRPPGL